MLSVIIPVLAPEPGLIDTLCALVPATANGLVRDLVLVSGDENAFAASVAEAAGCNRIVASGERAAQIQAAARTVKCPWVLVLEPGMVPAGAWVEETEDFLALDLQRAGAFTLAPPPGSSRFPFLLRNLATSATGRSHPLQGLLAPRERLAIGATSGSVVRLASPILDRRTLARRPRQS
jgi:hypothetical protein